MLDACTDSFEEWPEGNFALPESVYGCPDSEHSDWLRYSLTIQTTDQSWPNNTWSQTLKLRGPLADHLATVNFCVKSTQFGSARNAPWPPGIYCLLDAGSGCLSGSLF